MRVSKSSLRDAADFFERHARTTIRDCTSPGFELRLFNRSVTIETVERLYELFVQLVATVPDKTDEDLDRVSRQFARMLLTIVVTQQRLEAYVVLASRLPFYGLPSPSDILYGEKTEEGE